MTNENLPVKTDNNRIARTILFGPLGNFIYEQIKKTDYDRQAEAVLKLKEGGMEHGHVKMISNREGKLITKDGDVCYKQNHEGEYRW